MELQAIKEGFVIIRKKIIYFIQKALVFLFLYGRMNVFPVIFALGLFWMLNVIGASTTSSITVFKLSLIIGQLIPMASYAGIIHNDPNVEGSMDICFAGAIIVSMLVWYCL